MTPEERWTMLQNLIQSVIEAQAASGEKLDRLAERQAKQEAMIEQDRAAIRDLFALSRTMIDAQKQTDERLSALAGVVQVLTGKMNALADTVREGEGKMNALIDTVDRIIRRDNPPS